jgi:chorismate mutase
LADIHFVAIRGATTVVQDTPELIREATQELIRELVAANALETNQVVSAIFTLTQDLRSDFPARAARELGWNDVPLLCTVEIDVPGSQQRCIRVLLHVASERRREDVKHVYLRDAVTLRN